MAETGAVMDVEAVGEMAAGFRSAADALKAARQTLEAAILTLKDTAFIGSVGDQAVERFLSNIKPQMDRLAQKCEELNQDLTSAMASFHDQEPSDSN